MGTREEVPIPQRHNTGKDRLLDFRAGEGASALIICPLGPRVVPWAVGGLVLVSGCLAVAALQPLNCPCFPFLPLLLGDTCP